MCHWQINDSTLGKWFTESQTCWQNGCEYCMLEVSNIKKQVTKYLRRVFVLYKNWKHILFHFNVPVLIFFPPNFPTRRPLYIIKKAANHLVALPIHSLIGLKRKAIFLRLHWKLSPLLCSKASAGKLGGLFLQKTLHHLEI